jgi:hypothetical protein
MNKKQIGFFKIFAAIILLIISWLSVGIGYAVPIGPVWSTVLFLGGLLLFFLSSGFLIYKFIKSL